MDRIIKETNCSDSTVLDISDRFSLTGFIDFIKEEDFKESENTLIGVDQHGRKFLSVLVYSELPHVGTIFQRYADSDSEIAYGTCYNPFDGIWNSARIHSFKEIIDRIKALKLGKTIIIDDISYTFKKQIKN